MIDKLMFEKGDRVRHRNGNEYIIIGICTFEPSMVDCYCYQERSGRIWARPISQMEDGRFTVIEHNLGDLTI